MEHCSQQKIFAAAKISGARINEFIQLSIIFCFCNPSIKKKTLGKPKAFIGERVGVRTRDPLIKSQMLYQLSYAPLYNEWIYRG